VRAKHDSVGGVDGLDGAEGIAVSPDGAYVYVAGRNDNALAVCAREAGTGALAFVQMERNGIAGVAGLGGAKGVAVSPDGANVYAAGSLDNAVTVFARDAQSGKLAFIEVQQEGVNGVTGLLRARAVTVSPDGLNIYVAGGYDDALVVFGRNPETGMLVFLQLLEDSVGDLKDGDCCSSTCQFEDATTLCRPAAGPCDVAEFCTGTSGSCPVDRFQPATLECRGAVSPCDQTEFCTGRDSACPADAFKPATAVCRAAAG